MFPFTVQQVPEKVFHVDRHAQSPAHLRVGEQRAAVVVADVGIAEAQARKRLVRVVFLVPRYLVRLSSVVIHRAGPEFHLLRQQVGHDPHVIVLVFRGSFPIVVIAPEMNVFIAVPLDETETPAPDGAAVELTVAHAERFPRCVGEAALVHLPLHGFGVEQVFGKDAHGPGVDRRGEQPLVHHAHRMRVDYLNRLDRFEIRRARGQIPGIHKGVIRELHVAGVKLMAVVKPDALTEVKIDDGIVLGHGKQFRQLREHLGLDLRRDLLPESEGVFIRKIFEVAVADDRKQPLEKVLIHPVQGKRHPFGNVERHLHFPTRRVTVLVLHLNRHRGRPGHARQHVDGADVFSQRGKRLVLQRGPNPVGQTRSRDLGAVGQPVGRTGEQIRFFRNGPIRG